MKILKTIFNQFLILIFICSSSFAIVGIDNFSTNKADSKIIQHDDFGIDCKHKKINFENDCYICSSFIKHAFVKNLSLNIISKESNFNFLTKKESTPKSNLKYNFNLRAPPIS